MSIEHETDAATITAAMKEAMATGSAMIEMSPEGTTRLVPRDEIYPPVADAGFVQRERALFERSGGVKGAPLVEIDTPSFDRLLALAERGLAAEATPAARDVLAERRRQVEVEGWSPEHDDRHDGGEIARAAAAYATHAGWFRRAGDIEPHIWPWHSSWWKPTDRRRNLVKAGALILAEIERLDRLSAATPPQPARANEESE